MAVVPPETKNVMPHVIPFETINKIIHHPHKNAKSVESKRKSNESAEEQKSSAETTSINRVYKGIDDPMTRLDSAVHVKCTLEYKNPQKNCHDSDMFNDGMSSTDDLKCVESAADLKTLEEIPIDDAMYFERNKNKEEKNQQIPFENSNSKISDETPPTQSNKKSTPLIHATVQVSNDECKDGLEYQHHHEISKGEKRSHGRKSLEASLDSIGSDKKIRNSTGEYLKTLEHASDQETTPEKKLSEMKIGPRFPDEDDDDQAFPSQSTDDQFVLLEHASDLQCLEMLVECNEDCEGDHIVNKPISNAVTNNFEVPHQIESTQYAGFKRPQFKAILDNESSVRTVSDSNIEKKQLLRRTKHHSKRSKSAHEHRKRSGSTQGEEKCFDSHHQPDALNAEVQLKLPENLNKHAIASCEQEPIFGFEKPGNESKIPKTTEEHASYQHSSNDVKLCPQEQNNSTICGNKPSESQAGETEDLINIVCDDMKKQLEEKDIKVNTIASDFLQGNAEILSGQMERLESTDNQEESDTIDTCKQTSGVYENQKTIDSDVQRTDTKSQGSKQLLDSVCVPNDSCRDMFHEQQTIQNQESTTMPDKLKECTKGTDKTFDVQTDSLGQMLSVTCKFDSACTVNQESTSGETGGESRLSEYIQHHKMPIEVALQQKNQLILTKSVEVMNDQNAHPESFDDQNSHVRGVQKTTVVENDYSMNISSDQEIFNPKSSNSMNGDLNQPKACNTETEQTVASAEDVANPQMCLISANKRQASITDNNEAVIPNIGLISSSETIEELRTRTHARPEIKQNDKDQSTQLHSNICEGSASDVAENERQQQSIHMPTDTSLIFIEDQMIVVDENIPTGSSDLIKSIEGQASSYEVVTYNGKGNARIEDSINSIPVTERNGDACDINITQRTKMCDSDLAQTKRTKEEPKYSTSTQKEAIYNEMSGIHVNPDKTSITEQTEGTHMCPENTNNTKSQFDAVEYGAGIEDFMDHNDDELHGQKTPIEYSKVVSLPSNLNLTTYEGTGDHVKLHHSLQKDITDIESSGKLTHPTHSEQTSMEPIDGKCTNANNNKATSFDTGIEHKASDARHKESRQQHHEDMNDQQTSIECSKISSSDSNLDRITNNRIEDQRKLHSSGELTHTVQSSTMETMEEKAMCVDAIIDRTTSSAAGIEHKTSHAQDNEYKQKNKHISDQQALTECIKMASNDSSLDQTTSSKEISNPEKTDTIESMDGKGTYSDVTNDTERSLDAGVEHKTSYPKSNESEQHLDDVNNQQTPIECSKMASSIGLRTSERVEDQVKTHPSRELTHPEQTSTIEPTDISANATNYMETSLDTGETSDEKHKELEQQAPIECRKMSSSVSKIDQRTSERNKMIEDQVKLHSSGNLTDLEQTCTMEPMNDKRICGNATNNRDTSIDAGIEHKTSNLRSNESDVMNNQQTTIERSKMSSSASNLHQRTNERSALIDDVAKTHSLGDLSHPQQTGTMEAMEGKTICADATNGRKTTSDAGKEHKTSHAQNNESEQKNENSNDQQTSIECIKMAVTDYSLYQTTSSKELSHPEQTTTMGLMDIKSMCADVTNDKRSLDSGIEHKVSNARHCGSKQHHEDMDNPQTTIECSKTSSSYTNLHRRSNEKNEDLLKTHSLANLSHPVQTSTMEAMKGKTIYADLTNGRKTSSDAGLEQKTSRAQNNEYEQRNEDSDDQQALTECIKMASNDSSLDQTTSSKELSTMEPMDSTSTCAVVTYNIERSFDAGVDHKTSYPGSNESEQHHDDMNNHQTTIVGSKMSSSASNLYQRTNKRSEMIEDLLKTHSLANLSHPVQTSTMEVMEDKTICADVTNGRKTSSDAGLEQKTSHAQNSEYEQKNEDSDYQQALTECIKMASNDSSLDQTTSSKELTTMDPIDSTSMCAVVTYNIERSFDARVDHKTSYPGSNESEQHHDDMNNHQTTIEGSKMSSSASNLRQRTNKRSTMIEDLVKTHSLGNLSHPQQTGTMEAMEGNTICADAANGRKFASGAGIEHKTSHAQNNESELKNEDSIDHQPPIECIKMVPTDYRLCQTTSSKELSHPEQTSTMESMDGKSMRADVTNEKGRSYDQHKKSDARSKKSEHHEDTNNLQTPIGYSRMSSTDSNLVINSESSENQMNLHNISQNDSTGFDSFGEKINLDQTSTMEPIDGMSTFADASNDKERSFDARIEHRTSDAGSKESDQPHDDMNANQIPVECSKMSPADYNQDCTIIKRIEDHTMLHISGKITQTEQSRMDSKGDNATNDTVTSFDTEHKTLNAGSNEPEQHHEDIGCNKMALSDSNLDPRTNDEVHITVHPKSQKNIRGIKSSVELTHPEQPMESIDGKTKCADATTIRETSIDADIEHKKCDGRGNELEHDMNDQQASIECSKMIQTEHDKKTVNQVKLYLSSQKSFMLIESSEEQLQRTMKTLDSKTIFSSNTDDGETPCDAGIEQKATDERSKESEEHNGDVNNQQKPIECSRMSSNNYDRHQNVQTTEDGVNQVGSTQNETIDSKLSEGQTRWVETVTDHKSPVEQKENCKICPESMGDTMTTLEHGIDQKKCVVEIEDSNKHPSNPKKPCSADDIQAFNLDQKKSIITDKDSGKPPDSSVYLMTSERTGHIIDPESSKNQPKSEECALVRRCQHECEIDVKSGLGNQIKQAELAENVRTTLFDIGIDQILGARIEVTLDHSNFDSDQRQLCCHNSAPSDFISGHENNSTSHVEHLGHAWKEKKGLLSIGDQVPFKGPESEVDDRMRVLETSQGHKKQPTNADNTWNQPESTINQKLTAAKDESCKGGTAPDQNMSTVGNQDQRTPPKSDLDHTLRLKMSENNVQNHDTAVECDHIKQFNLETHQNGTVGNTDEMDARDKQKPCSSEEHKVKVEMNEDFKKQSKSENNGITHFDQNTDTICDVSITDRIKSYTNQSENTESHPINALITTITTTDADENILVSSISKSHSSDHTIVLDSRKEVGKINVIPESIQYPTANSDNEIKHFEFSKVTQVSTESEGQKSSNELTASNEIPSYDSNTDQSSTIPEVNNSNGKIYNIPTDNSVEKIVPQGLGRSETGMIEHNGTISKIANQPCTDFMRGNEESTNQSEKQFENVSDHLKPSVSSIDLSRAIEHSRSHSKRAQNLKKHRKNTSDKKIPANSAASFERTPERNKDERKILEMLHDKNVPTDRLQGQNEVQVQKQQTEMSQDQKHLSKMMQYQKVTVLSAAKPIHADQKILDEKSSIKAIDVQSRHPEIVCSRKKPFYCRTDRKTMVGGIGDIKRYTECLKGQRSPNDSMLNQKMHHDTCADQKTTAEVCEVGLKDNKHTLYKEKSIEETHDQIVQHSSESVGVITVNQDTHTNSIAIQITNNGAAELLPQPDPMMGKTENWEELKYHVISDNLVMPIDCKLDQVGKTEGIEQIVMHFENRHDDRHLNGTVSKEPSESRNAVDETMHTKCAQNQEESNENKPIRKKLPLHHRKTLGEDLHHSKNKPAEKQVRPLECTNEQNASIICHDDQQQEIASSDVQKKPAGEKNADFSTVEVKPTQVFSEEVQSILEQKSIVGVNVSLLNDYQGTSNQSKLSLLEHDQVNSQGSVPTRTKNTKRSKKPKKRAKSESDLLKPLEPRTLINISYQSKLIESVTKKDTSKMVTDYTPCDEIESKKKISAEIRRDENEIARDLNESVETAEIAMMQNGSAGIAAEISLNHKGSAGIARDQNESAAIARDQKETAEITRNQKNAEITSDQKESAENTAIKEHAEHTSDQNESAKIIRDQTETASDQKESDGIKTDQNEAASDQREIARDQKESVEIKVDLKQHAEIANDRIESAQVTNDQKEPASDGIEIIIDQTETSEIIGDQNESAEITKDQQGTASDEKEIACNQKKPAQILIYQNEIIRDQKEHAGITMDQKGSADYRKEFGVSTSDHNTVHSADKTLHEEVFEDNWATDHQKRVLETSCELLNIHIQDLISIEHESENLNSLEAVPQQAEMFEKVGYQIEQMETNSTQQNTFVSSTGQETPTDVLITSQAIVEGIVDHLKFSKPERAGENTTYAESSSDCKLHPNRADDQTKEFIDQKKTFEDQHPDLDSDQKPSTRSSDIDQYQLQPVRGIDDVAGSQLKHINDVQIELPSDQTKSVVSEVSQPRNFKKIRENRKHTRSANDLKMPLQSEVPNVTLRQDLNHEIHPESAVEKRKDNRKLAKSKSVLKNPIMPQMQKVTLQKTFKNDNRPKAIVEPVVPTESSNSKQELYTQVEVQTSSGGNSLSMCQSPSIFSELPAQTHLESIADQRRSIKGKGDDEEQDIPNIAGKIPGCEGNQSTKPGDVHVHEKGMDLITGQMIIDSSCEKITLIDPVEPHNNHFDVIPCLVTEYNLKPTESLTMEEMKPTFGDDQSKAKEMGIVNKRRAKSAGEKKKHFKSRKPTINFANIEHHTAYSESSLENRAIDAEDRSKHFVRDQAMQGIPLVKKKTHPLEIQRNLEITDDSTIIQQNTSENLVRNPVNVINQHESNNITTNTVILPYGVLTVKKVESAQGTSSSLDSSAIQIKATKKGIVHKKRAKSAGALKKPLKPVMKANAVEQGINFDMCSENSPAPSGSISHTGVHSIVHEHYPDEQKFYTKQSEALGRTQDYINPPDYPDANKEHELAGGQERELKNAVADNGYLNNCIGSNGRDKLFENTFDLMKHTEVVVEKTEQYLDTSTVNIPDQLKHLENMHLGSTPDSSKDQAVYKKDQTGSEEWIIDHRKQQESIETAVNQITHPTTIDQTLTIEIRAKYDNESEQQHLIKTDEYKTEAVHCGIEQQSNEEKFVHVYLDTIHQDSDPYSLMPHKSVGAQMHFMQQTVLNEVKTLTKNESYNNSVDSFVDSKGLLEQAVHQKVPGITKSVLKRRAKSAGDYTKPLHSGTHKRTKKHNSDNFIHSPSREDQKAPITDHKEQHMLLSVDQIRENDSGKRSSHNMTQDPKQHIGNGNVGENSVSYVEHFKSCSVNELVKPFDAELSLTLPDHKAFSESIGEQSATLRSVSTHELDLESSMGERFEPLEVTEYMIKDARGILEKSDLAKDGEQVTSTEGEYNKHIDKDYPDCEHDQSKLIQSSDSLLPLSTELISTVDMIDVLQNNIDSAQYQKNFEMAIVEDQTKPIRLSHSELPHEYKSTVDVVEILFKSISHAQNQNLACDDQTILGSNSQKKLLAEQRSTVDMVELLSKNIDCSQIERKHSSEIANGEIKATQFPNSETETMHSGVVQNTIDMVEFLSKSIDLSQYQRKTSSERTGDEMKLIQGSNSQTEMFTSGAEQKGTTDMVELLSKSIDFSQYQREMSSERTENEMKPIQGSNSQTELLPSGAEQKGTTDMVELLSKSIDFSQYQREMSSERTENEMKPIQGSNSQTELLPSGAEQKGTTDMVEFLSKSIDFSQYQREMSSERTENEMKPIQGSNRQTELLPSGAEQKSATDMVEFLSKSIDFSQYQKELSSERAEDEVKPTQGSNSQIEMLPSGAEQKSSTDMVELLSKSIDLSQYQREMFRERAEDEMQPNQGSNSHPSGEEQKSITDMVELLSKSVDFSQYRRELSSERANHEVKKARSSNSQTEMLPSGEEQKSTTDMVELLSKSIDFSQYQREMSSERAEDEVKQTLGSNSQTEILPSGEEQKSTTDMVEFLSKSIDISQYHRETSSEIEENEVKPNQSSNSQSEMLPSGAEEKSTTDMVEFLSKNIDVSQYRREIFSEIAEDQVKPIQSSNSQTEMLSSGAEQKSTTDMVDFLSKSIDFSQYQRKTSSEIAGNEVKPTEGSNSETEMLPSGAGQKSNTDMVEFLSKSIDVSQYQGETCSERAEDDVKSIQGSNSQAEMFPSGAQQKSTTDMVEFLLNSIDKTHYQRETCNESAEDEIKPIQGSKSQIEMLHSGAEQKSTTDLVELLSKSIDISQYQRETPSEIAEDEVKPTHSSNTQTGVEQKSTTDMVEFLSKTIACSQYQMETSSEIAEDEVKPTQISKSQAEMLPFGAEQKSITDMVEFLSKTIDCSQYQREMSGEIEGKPEPIQCYNSDLEIHHEQRSVVDVVEFLSKSIDSSQYQNKSCSKITSDEANEIQSTASQTDMLKEQKSTVDVVEFLLKSIGQSQHQMDSGNSTSDKMIVSDKIHFNQEESTKLTEIPLEIDNSESSTFQCGPLEVTMNQIKAFEAIEDSKVHQDNGELAKNKDNHLEFTGQLESINPTISADTFQQTSINSGNAIETVEELKEEKPFGSSTGPLELTLQMIKSVEITADHTKEKKSLDNSSTKQKGSEVNALPETYLQPSKKEQKQLKEEKRRYTIAGKGKQLSCTAVDRKHHSSAVDMRSLGSFTEVASSRSAVDVRKQINEQKIFGSSVDIRKKSGDEKHFSSAEKPHSEEKLLVSAIEAKKILSDEKGLASVESENGPRDLEKKDQNECISEVKDKQQLDSVVVELGSAKTDMNITTAEVACVDTNNRVVHHFIASSDPTKLDQKYIASLMKPSLSTTPKPKEQTHSKMSIGADVKFEKVVERQGDAVIAPAAAKHESQHSSAASREHLESSSYELQNHLSPEPVQTKPAGSEQENFDAMKKKVDLLTIKGMPVLNEKKQIDSTAENGKLPDSSAVERKPAAKEHKYFDSTRRRFNSAAMDYGSDAMESEDAEFAQTTQTQLDSAAQEERYFSSTSEEEKDSHTGHHRHADKHVAQRKPEVQNIRTQFADQRKQDQRLLAKPVQNEDNKSKQSSHPSASKMKSAHVGVDPRDIADMWGTNAHARPWDTGQYNAARKDSPEVRAYPLSEYRPQHNAQVP